MSARHHPCIVVRVLVQGVSVLKAQLAATAAPQRVEAAEAAQCRQQQQQQQGAKLSPSTSQLADLEANIAMLDTQLQAINVQKAKRRASQSAAKAARKAQEADAAELRQQLAKVQGKMQAAQAEHELQVKVLKEQLQQQQEDLFKFEALADVFKAVIAEAAAAKAQHEPLQSQVSHESSRSADAAAEAAALQQVTQLQQQLEASEKRLADAQDMLQQAAAAAQVIGVTAGVT
jgi:chromosome segregation ATPase